MYPPDKKRRLLIIIIIVSVTVPLVNDGDHGQISGFLSQLFSGS